MIIISACLLGRNVKYSGGNNLTPWLAAYYDPALFLPLCPECIARLPIPRPPVEIRNGTGTNVLAGSARVYNKDQEDVTRHFLYGAATTLHLARNHQVSAAILKEGSPSCGVTRIYDGTFSGRRIPGQGVTAALFQQYGIPLYSEQTLTESILRELIRREKELQNPKI